MAQVFIGIGSNSQPDVHIPRALSALSEILDDIESSPYYLSPAVNDAQGEFVNFVLAGETSLLPHELVRQFKIIEKRCGRGASRQTIDIDLLLYDSLVISDGALQIPRKDIETFPFVLMPLAVMAPNFQHPVLGISLLELWERSGLDCAMMKEIALKDLESE